MLPHDDPCDRLARPRRAVGVGDIDARLQQQMLVIVEGTPDEQAGTTVYIISKISKYIKGGPTMKVTYDQEQTP